MRCREANAVMAFGVWYKSPICPGLSLRRFQIQILADNSIMLSQSNWKT